MKVIIAGSRTITRYHHLLHAIELAYENGIKVTEVVSGGAKGVDLMGEQLAERSCLPLHIYPANWDRYGKKAGYLRNKQMAEFADALIAVWDGKSKGTKIMIELAKKNNLKIYVYKLR